MSVHSQKDWKQWNSEGFFPSVEDDEASYEKKRSEFIHWSDQLYYEDLKIDKYKVLLPQSDRIPQERLQIFGQSARVLYKIFPEWVPAYTSDQGLPLLTGGMAVSFQDEAQSMKTWFQLKKIYQKKDQWLIYRAEEIVSHEMCHVARAPLESKRYEEYFAYQTSTSALRRYIGGALVHASDTTWILLALSIPLLFLLFSPWVSFFFQYSSWSYLPLILILGLGLIRNANIRREIKQAKTKLKPLFTDQTREVLFRLTDQEIKELTQQEDLDVKQWWNQRSGFRGQWLRECYPLP